MLASGMTMPTLGMAEQLNHMLRFLNFSKDQKLTYGKHDPLVELDLSSVIYDPDELVGFSDSNHMMDRSTSSTITMYKNAALYWRVKKQDTPALSSVESELTALTEQARDVRLLRDVFGFLDIPTDQPTTVFSDSRGAIQNAKHSSFSERLRHTDNKIFYIRSLVQRSMAEVRWIPTKMNPADIGTKALGAIYYRLFASFIMNDTIEHRSAKQIARAAWRRRQ